MSVNIKKLRIGNVVSIEGVMTLITSIHEDMVNVGVTPDGRIDGYKFEQVNHIKLTEEMLIQFGFLKQKEQSIIIGQGKIFFQHSCGMFLYPLTNGTYYLLHYEHLIISSVTQLQNILLDLFNFDLIIQL